MQRQDPSPELTRGLGRLTLPSDTEGRRPQAGTHRLDLEEGEAVLHVPRRLAETGPWPLILMLHGAGGNAGHSIGLFSHVADGTGVLLLAPSSRGSTWDLLRGGWGADVALIEAALDEVLGEYDVDRLRLGIGGFSDGASYALSLGFTNGDLFSHILAFSPGFMAPAMYEGRPACFISHGTDDHVLPIDRCSRRLVRALRTIGYDVRYEEFEGGHEVPAGIAAVGFDWYLA